MISVLLVMLVGCVQIFAQEGTIPELADGANKVLELFSSDLMRIIMTIALIVIFIIIGVGNSQGSSDIFKKAAPWIIAVVGVGAASKITEYFMNNV